MWESIAEIALHIVRWFVKDAGRKAEWERAILEALSRWNRRPPRSKMLKDAWADILRQIEEDRRNGLRKEETKAET